MLQNRNTTRKMTQNYDLSTELEEQENKDIFFCKLNFHFPMRILPINKDLLLSSHGESGIQSPHQCFNL
ncbi:hypothetical protein Hanom_Chr14g01299581 [Helianthus anomalus]